MKNNRIATVMLVEDSLSDQTIIKRSLEDGNVHCKLCIANNGKEALDMLANQPPYEDKTLYPSPDLILLDINMPVLNGKDTLRRIRQSPELKHLPVVMLTTSTRESDVIESYQLGVNAYLAKPAEEADFVNAVVCLNQFWFQVAKLPSETAEF